MTEWVEWSKLGLQAFTAVVVGVSAFFAAHQLRLLRATYRDSHDWNRRKAAQDAIEKYTGVQEDVPKLDEKFGIMRSNDPVSLDLIQRECAADSTLRTMLHRRLNFFEFLAIGCNQGIYDEQVVGNAFKPVFARSLNQFQAYIDHRRGAGGQGAWSQFEVLAEKWRSELEVEPPRPPIGGRA